MQKRRFGRTGHMSTVIIFGAYAVAKVSQTVADSVMEEVMEHGVNHIDVAPSYFDAEVRLGPWLEKHRHRFFLGCKTNLRHRDAAWADLNRSLERLRVDHFDLYQLHEVTTKEDLDRCLSPGGSLEAIIEARDQGLTRFIGITGHGLQAPALQLAALQQFDFDSLLFPLNAKLWSDEAYREDATALLKVAAERDLGTMVIKAWVREPWGGRTPVYDTWYRPFDDRQGIERALRFALAQPISGVINAGDSRLVPLILEAAERVEPMLAAEQAQTVADAAGYEPLFT